MTSPRSKPVERRPTPASKGHQASSQVMRNKLSRRWRAGQVAGLPKGAEENGSGKRETQRKLRGNPLAGGPGQNGKCDERPEA